MRNYRRVDMFDLNFDFNPGPLFGVVILIGLAALAFEIWMLVDALRRPEDEFGSPGARTGWTVALVLGLFLTGIGLAIAVAYFVVVRRPAEERRRTRATVPPPPSPPASAGGFNCRSCGTKLPAGARYCHSCGTPTA